MSLEPRVAKLESDVNHIMTDIAEIKIDIRRLDSDIKTEVHRLDSKIESSFITLNNRIDSNFKWLMSTFLIAFIASFGGLAAMMAHGFHWF